MVHLGGLPLKRKITLFVGITDFAAAFDSISRRILFQKLVRLGIGAFMLQALKNMYAQATVVLEMNGEYSDPFDLTAGVIQGSATSTILFIAYTADLIELFKRTFPAEEIINLFHLLVHADDALILATTKSSLVEKFKVLENYCEENKIQLQPPKCSFLSINSSDKDSIKLKAGVIHCASQAIYLGSTVTDIGNINKDIKEEVKSKEKAFNKYFSFLQQNYNAPLNVKLKVLHACLYLSVLYNCETWGNANLNDLEKQYRDILKYILGIRNGSCNEFPYLELGLPTLKSIVQSRQHKFYMNILKNQDWPLLRYIVNQGRQCNVNFIKHYDKLVSMTNDSESFKTNSIKNLQDQVRKKALSGCSRYVKYTIINPTLSKPRTIYSHFVATRKLHALTRLRTSSHALAVEIGRHGRQKKPLEERLCSCKEIEDEEHFLLKCPHYDNIRNRFISQLPGLGIAELLQMDFAPQFVDLLLKERELYNK